MIAPIGVDKPAASTDTPVVRLHAGACAAAERTQSSRPAMSRIAVLVSFRSFCEAYFSFTRGYSDGGWLVFSSPGFD
jgi:hypothetical protein